MDYIGTFGSNNEVTIPIRSKGDLLSYLWIEAKSISNVQTNNDGLFSNTASEPTEFSLHIGGQEVARLDSLYIQGVHNVLYRENGARASCTVTTNEVSGNARGTAVEPSADYYMIPFFFAEDFTKCLPCVVSRTMKSKFVSSAAMDLHQRKHPRCMVCMCI